MPFLLNIFKKDYQSVACRPHFFVEENGSVWYN